MKVGKITIEAVSIFCECGQFVADPYSGSSLLDLEEYTKLPHRIVCSGCGTTFFKPVVPSYKVREDRASRHYQH